MNKTLRDASLSSLFLLCFLFITSNVNAQTPGLIYKIATNGGNKVLDPDGNGYVSKTNLGFQLVGGNRLDEGPEYSEIPYRPFPVFMDEPLADLKTGGSYGHTDFAPKVYANGQLVGSPMASYYDGKNFLFRVRLAGQSTASKGYSILIDTNNTLTGTGTNPGFEFEVLLATNFDVRVYDYTSNPSGVQIFSGSVDQYSQKAIAGSTGGGDADYFYDFYVPMTAFLGGITESTPLRMTGVTVTSAKSGIFGTASDFGGVDDNAYTGTTVADIWKEVINSTPTTTPTTIKDTGFTPVTATAPKVNSPIYSYSTLISGTSIEAAGSVVTVYRNGVSIGTATVTSSGSWTLQNLAGNLLQPNDIIKADIKPATETISAYSTAVTVTSGVCNTAPPKITAAEQAGKGLIFTTSVLGKQFIKIYKDGILADTATRTTTSVPASITYSCRTGNCFSSGVFTISITPAGQCESLLSNSFCQNGSTETVNAAPTISTSPLTTTSTSITGTFTKAGTITLYKNGSLVPNNSVTTAGTSNWTITFSGVTLAAGDKIHVVATSSGNCSTSEVSNSLIVQGRTTAPVITGTYCGPTTSVTGTSTEVAGTTISIYSLDASDNIITPALVTTSVNANGAWTANTSTITPGIKIAARALASSKTESINSNKVTINTLYSNTGLAITGTETGGTIYEGSTSVKGNAPAGSIVTLYINGAPYVDKDGIAITSSAAGGSFLFSNISPFELYAGAPLTITARATSTSCESSKSTPAVIVACNPVTSTATALLTANTICPGTSAYIKLSTTEAGVIYNIYKVDGGTYTQFGPSMLGNGSAITLQSDPVTVSGTKLLVRTIKVGAPCQYTIGTEQTVSLYPAVPNGFTITSTPVNASCSNLQTITVQNAQTGYSYQLIINNATKDKIGSAIVPSVAGNISFPPVTVPTTTTYGVVITGTASGCVAENTLLRTITISGGPDLNRAVTTNQTTICAGTSATISVETQGNTFTYKIYQEGNATPLATFTGTNAKVDRTLSTPFTTTGTKNFYVTVSDGSCSDLRMTQTISITVTDGTGGTVSAGPNATSCGSTYTLAGSIPTPGTGKWTVILKPATAADPIFSNNTLYNSTVSGLVPGDYTFQWAVTPTCAGATTVNSTVTITVNCPAEYSIRSNKPITDYSNDEIIATATDPEEIQSAQLVAGKGSLPPGIHLNTSTGLLSVTTATSLVSNNYSFVIRITDKLGKTTDIPLALRFYSSSIRPPDITPLPVELISFTATTDLKGVLLNWMTASELDNDRFEIERSEDGKVFSMIGTVAGNGTSNRKIKYSFTDTKPLPDVSYYRLKQVDFDGKHKYSKIVSVKSKAITANTMLEAYPNPFSQKLYVTITTPAPEEAVLTLYDLQGRQLYTIKTALQRGMNSYDLDTQQLARGIYIIRITGNNSDVSVKVLKK